MYPTVSQFEKGRTSKIIGGVVIVVEGVKNLLTKYHAYRQKEADRRVALYIKDHGDVERLQRNLSDLRTNMLFYAR